MKIKHIIVGLLSVVSLSATAQISTSADTVWVEIGRDKIAKPIINITNNSTSSQDVYWSSTKADCIIPTGYEIQGICELPGLCYSFPYSNTFNFAASATVAMEPAVVVTDSARLDSACVVKLKTDINGGKDLVYIIKAIKWPTSINKVNGTKINLELYPSPVVNKLNVIHNNDKVTKAIVYNVLGKKMEEFVTPANANGFSIQIAHLPAGMYILEVRDDKNLPIATQRFNKN